jgi:hypothetical protein
VEEAAEATFLRHVSPKALEIQSKKGRRARGLKERPDRLRLTSNLVFSAIILWNPIPTPSITAKKHAHMIAEFRAAFIPPLIASAPPVKKPAITVHKNSASCPLTVCRDLPKISPLFSIQENRKEQNRGTTYSRCKDPPSS